MLEFLGSTCLIQLVYVVPFPGIEVRLSAVKALAHILENHNEENEQALRAIAACLRDKNSKKVREAASKALSLVAGGGSDWLLYSGGDADHTTASSDEVSLSSDEELSLSELSLSDSDSPSSKNEKFSRRTATSRRRSSSSEDSDSWRADRVLRRRTGQDRVLRSRRSRSRRTGQSSSSEDSDSSSSDDDSSCSDKEDSNRRRPLRPRKWSSSDDDSSSECSSDDTSECDPSVYKGDTNKQFLSPRV